MRPTLTIISLCVLSVVLARSQRASTPNFKPKGGYVPTEETAIGVAEAVLIPVYGEKQIVSERPFHAELKDGVWTVSGSLHCEMPCFGGAAEVKISKSTGEILHMIHYK